MAKIEIFSGPNCGYCRRAKALLDAKGWAYEELDVAGEAGHREELMRRLPRVRALPQIFIAGEHIGSFEDLELLDRSGRLDALVAGPPR
jgi:glutaredoxin 3